MTEQELFEKIPQLAQVEKRQDPRLRGVKSYVLRGQRLKDNQLKVLEQHFYDWALTYKDEKLNFREVFGNDNPVVMEIGFGMGTSTARIAAANPNINYIGIEVFLYGFSKLMLEIQNKGLKNLRVMRFDAVQVLTDMIEDSSISGFHIFFPDPWPKKRHSKRRLIQHDFAQLLSSKLKAGGYIYCVTDWQEYADQMLEVFDGVESLINPHDGFAPAIEWRPETSFERKGLEKNYSINEVWVEKRH